ncbi:MAG: DUF2764 family protein [Waddliaceae bacterium]|jgi:hypothetical protein|nr:DUF2764 family protein [Waddliaceae bacterium]MBT3579071.1 DUF2764 family protein [Waddliaceae bacterium]MBT4444781.1 DUF2764 family protein [Waddliaceae bacterium]MBT6928050.1 DUF2764 family protein [Waddliaceae bacterium]MBT7264434.1 DUF2764 family protein [Waddliaceae bacterium]
MSNYYFSSSALPAIEVGVKPTISFLEVKGLLKLNISARDYQKSVIVRRLIDIENLRALWKGESFDHRGNYTAKQLEEVLVTQEGLAEYVFDFLDKYTTTEERLKNFAALMSNFFTEEIAKSEGFLKKYLIFEREWRLVLLGFRAKALGRDVIAELQYEDPDDDIIAQIIAQKDAKSYEPPDGYEDFKSVFYEKYEDPIRLHKEVCVYRFNRIEEMLFGQRFSISRIIGYMVQLIIVERWQELDKNKGNDVVNTIVKAIKLS